MQQLADHPVTRWWADRVRELGQRGTDLSDPQLAAATTHAAREAGLLQLPQPGSAAGATRARWSALAAMSAADVTLAKLGEAHADAMVILSELAGPADADPELWAVWAAAPGSLRAQPTRSGWRLSGIKPWASGSTCCQRALITASAPDGQRLFAVDVAAPGISRTEPSWAGLAMTGTATATLALVDVAGDPVGEPGDYVGRPGFAHGGAGIAACWYGGAVGIARLLAERETGAPDPHRDAHLGVVHAALTRARSSLDRVADDIDASPDSDATLWADTLRAVVESTAVEVIDRVGRALGPTPLALDRAHARRVADLGLFLRQSHGEADLARVGRAVAERGPAVAGW